MINTRIDSDALTVSGAAWVFGLFLGICFVGLAHEPQYLGFSDDTGIEQGEGLDDRVAFDKDVNAAPKAKRLGFIGVIMLGLAALISSGGKNKFQFSSMLLFAAVVLAFVFGSLLWSDVPSKTARELFRIAVYGFIGFSFALRFRPQEICLILGITFAISVLTACTAELLSGNFQPWRGEYRLGGTLHTNTISNHAAILAIICFTFLRTSRYRAFLVIILLAAFSVIILSKTRGALLTTAVGITTSQLIYVWNNDRSAQLGILAGVMGLGLFLCVGALLFAKSPGFRNVVLLGRAEGAVTLTGRIPLWKLVWKEAEGKRALGFGYGAFWKEENLEITNDELEWYANHAHSSYVHTMLDIGLAGLAAYIAFAFACMRRARNMLAASRNTSFCFFFAYFAAGFMDSCLEVSFIYPRGLGLFGMIIVAALMMTPVKVPDEDDELSAGIQKPESRVAIPV